MSYQRAGTCNRCGECCGSNGVTSAWCDYWPDTLDHFLDTVLLELYPWLETIKIPSKGGTQYGHFTLQGKSIGWVWVTGNGLCKLLPPYTNPASYSLECPFLLPVAKDGTRPCGLVGTKYQAAYDQLCGPLPRERISDEEYYWWIANRPSCSYTWEVV